MTEQSLVATLINSEVRFPWIRNKIDYLTEVRVTTNRVDVVYFEKKSNSEIGSIIAIEAKLKDWRRALQQANRDRLFADMTYVVLPEQHCAAALANIDHFRRASVGLMTVGDAGVKAYYHPPRNNRRSETHVARVRGVLAAAI